MTDKISRPESKMAEVVIFTWQDYESGTPNALRKVKALERSWRKSVVVSEVELLQAFPQAKGVILQNLGRWKSTKRKLLSRLRGQLDMAERSLLPENRWFGRELVKHLSPTPKAILELNRRIGHLERLKWLMGAPKEKQRISFHNQIDLIGQMSIAEIAKPYLEKTQRVGNDQIIALCPFHQDSNPSFRLYLGDNHYHCFACQAHGDSITFIQKIHGCSLREAVAYLVNAHYGRKI